MIERMIYQVELDSKPQHRTDLRVGWNKKINAHAQIKA